MVSTRITSLFTVKANFLSLQYIVVHLGHYQAVQYNIHIGGSTACLIYTVVYKCNIQILYGIDDSMLFILLIYESSWCWWQHIHPKHNISTLHYAVNQPGRLLIIKLINVSHINYRTLPIEMN